MENCSLPLEYSKINDEIHQRAVKELNETTENRIQCLKELKEMIKCEKNLESDMSDNFLLQFLRVKKFDTDRAFSLLKKYYGHRMYYKSLYKKFSPTNISKVLETNMMNFLPWRNPEGSAVWVSRVGLWEPEHASFDEIVRCGLICNEKALQNPVTQICGIVSIVDFKKFSWSHLFHISPTAINCFVSASQNCFPIRHKAIHVVNNPGVFTVLFAMIKPLLKEKIKKRIYFHGDNMSSLHEYLPPDILPKEYGGTRGKFENSKFFDSLMESENEFIHNSKFGYRD
ncbi:alpha-tocopherol transfer protein-like [Parasteatoda tepidariorum]|uniref:alpha-tocopherol transfer protein-like n=1 Tax=Parasteatoda tepidariorum TaxID=114398 RepID=UPI00077FBD98|nr:alpha-tocopherol transfer protein-like [Parasteatoda tepidariorum]